MAAIELPKKLKEMLEKQKKLIEAYRKAKKR